MNPVEGSNHEGHEILGATLGLPSAVALYLFIKDYLYHAHAHQSEDLPPLEIAFDNTCEAIIVRTWFTDGAWLELLDAIRYIQFREQLYGTE